MAHVVRNTQRQPLDVEISGKGANLHLGPKGGGNERSRGLTEAEMESPDVKRHIAAGRLVVEDAPVKPKRNEGKGGDE